MRNNIEQARGANMRIDQGWFLASANIVPPDNYVLDPASPPFLILNPAGAVGILMPVSTEARKGLTFLMVNVSASTITLKTSAGAGFATAIVLLAGESTLVFCTGDATANLGWRAIGTTTSA